MSNPAIISLNGDIQRQGIKVDVEDWLDMGSKTWVTTPDAVKAAAYQAAMVVGWKDSGLLKIMMDTWPSRIDEDQAKVTLEVLQALAKKFPCGVEEIKKDTSSPPVFKIKGCDKTLPFPLES